MVTEDYDCFNLSAMRKIAKLYEENQSERLKNEMLRECLRDQKHAKAKWMKACKQAKQKHQAIEDSGIREMLMDIEARCDALDKKNAQTVDELLAERSLVRSILMLDKKGSMSVRSDMVFITNRLA